MNDLIAFLGRLRAKIEEHRSDYLNNETAVRTQLIDPTLRELGWDVTEPKQVKTNERLEERVPDYRLINEKRNYYLEAKNLGAGVQSRDVVGQLADYCFKAGAKYGITSNGATWLLVKSFEEGKPLEQRIVWKLEVERDDLVSCARKLWTIRRDRIEKLEETSKKNELMNEVWESQIKDVTEFVKGLSPTMEGLLNLKHHPLKFERQEVEEFLTEKLKTIFLSINSRDVGFPAPSFERPKTRRAEAPKLRSERMFIGNEEFKVRIAKDILVNTGEWLIRQRKLPPGVKPVSSGGFRYILNSVPKHSDESEFRESKRLSNGMWVETHADRDRLIELSRRLLSHFGFDGQLLSFG